MCLSGEEKCLMVYSLLSLGLEDTYTSLGSGHSKLFNYTEIKISL